MSATPSPKGLTPTLEKLLEQLDDRDLAPRLRRIYLAAGGAIANLSELDLLKYETSGVEESADLTLWEEVAPVIARTVIDVNELLAVIREELDPESESGIAGLLNEAVEEASREFEPEKYRRNQEAIASLKRSSEDLSAQIVALGNRVRSPDIVSDKWNLIAEVQSFRSRFREEIGNLVFKSVSCFAEFHPKEIIPGYGDELKAALTVRTTVTDLSRVIAARAEKIRNAEPEDLQYEAQQLLGEMDLFGKTPGYRALRAHDKQQVLRYRARLGEMALNPLPTQEELIEEVEPFVTVVDSLRGVNQREILRAHDRELWASCGVKLENAERLLSGDPESAARAIAMAVALAQGLYGRSPELDAYLRRARKAQLTREPAALKAELDHVQQLLSGLSVA